MEQRIFHSTKISLEMRQEIESFIEELQKFSQGSFSSISLFVRKDTEYKIELKLWGYEDQVTESAAGLDFFQTLETLKDAAFNKLLTNVVLTAT